MLNTCDIFNLPLNNTNVLCKHKKRTQLMCSMTNTMDAFELLHL